MAKFAILFMTKTAERTIPFRAAHTYKTHIRAGITLPPDPRATNMQEVEDIWIQWDLCDS